MIINYKNYSRAHLQRQFIKSKCFNSIMSAMAIVATVYPRSSKEVCRKFSYCIQCLCTSYHLTMLFHVNAGFALLYRRAVAIQSSSCVVVVSRH